MTRNIDELSNLTTRAVEPEKYFGEMDLNEEQVDRRLKYTKKANELFDVILILLMTMRDNGTLDYVYARDMLETWLLSLISEFTTPDDYLIDYATDTAYNFVDTTKNHIDEPWYTSSDRSLFNAENSANDVMNYSEYIDALHSGKTHKKWITEKDNRVRKTHKGLDGKTIGITEVFHVGFALMRFPKDYDLAMSFPEELINCRCSIEYLPKDIENKSNNVIIKERRVSTGGHRNEKPLTDSQKEEGVFLMREQGYNGPIIFSDDSNTSIHNVIEGDYFDYMVIGSDLFPTYPNTGSANDNMSARGGAAHEVIGHYEAFLKGTTQNNEFLEEAQASFRASKFGINLSDEERKILWQDGLDRLKHGNFDYEDVKNLLDIWER